MYGKVKCDIVPTMIKNVLIQIRFPSVLEEYKFIKKNSQFRVLIIKKNKQFIPKF
jgi:hypothetical protein